ncbi:Cell division initiation protein DivIVA [Anaerovibrio sp. JC8]|uniref:DivIVA domain-containing protein n=1 Tax=Anaerovibrio sp. JC8 TaxID=1240085 RepID=UPI000A0BABBB|nr:DivIVA domain-containing protein [Anaerovibrio sp. JC8]ORU00696.1 Cell division initiation protein DivIVA [Anaerovibrio sp. JC8]
MLTPVDIHNQEFKVSFRGYDREEIDDFLDQVVNDYEKLFRENSQLKKEVELNEKALGQYHQLEKNLQDTLLVAQRTADEVTNTANTRAEEIRAAAKQASDNIIHAAEIEAKRRLEDAAQKVREAVTEYERIVSEKRQFIAKMRNTLKTELSLLEDAEQQFPDKQESQVLQDVNIEIGTKPADVQEQEVTEEEAEVASEENEF